ncbi:MULTISPECIES: hypothetical protein [unclassified Microbacterium]|uniref:hypothetical protein n=1 Tax=unclassified Microbacterium TaxID=2609290 RepID=UPI0020354B5C|nr:MULTISPECIES: hypothetical protein [unclassified Microbacterium]
MATIGFFALAVFGLGAVSLLTDADLIAMPGLGPAPGVIGMLSGIVAFAAMSWSTLRTPHPSFTSAFAIALVTGLVHLVGIWLAVMIGSGNAVIATAVAGDFVRGGASVALLLAAAIAAWGGIALRRTKAAQPRWPWERDEEE